MIFFLFQVHEVRVSELAQWLVMRKCRQHGAEFRQVQSNMTHIFIYKRDNIILYFEYRSNHLLTFSQYFILYIDVFH